MRSAAICVLCILMILQCFASISAVDLGDGAASGDGLIRPRRLLQDATARPVRSQPLRSAAGAAVEIEVSASLRKQTPSKSNPRQN
ncbi:hypothetical protein E2562_006334 [Oryza meyeriana var. granulata]|uniref:Uncharacterized protein n=1 Tax=Oryza meyeriana var. granulata TaxID=110450 RepID=A0A6G1EHJ8_9ORYZ|nr:hypothetical protein E2562_006334 [Oryza meyeriana var. granulata]